jgi:DNA polymerase-3 subunit delta'
VPLAEIVGQDRAVARLRRAWAEGRLPQAYCFFGPPGVGKRTTALALAQAVNCAEPSGGAEAAAPDACGRCAACRQIAAGQHPDVMLVRPEGKTVITIDQVREVAARAALRAYEGRMQVFILDPADLMQEPAGNALLKTLEEPAGASLFVLVTASPAALLPTVLSRCQAVRFEPLGEGPLKTILVRHGRGPEEAAAAAALGGGSAERALALDVEEARAARDRILEEVWGALRSPLGILECAEALAADRARLEAALESLLGVSRDLLVAKVGGAAAPLLHADRRDELLRLAAGRSARTLLSIYEAQQEALRALAKNANPRFTAERMLLKMRQAAGEAQPRPGGRGGEGGHAARGAR